MSIPRWAGRPLSFGTRTFRPYWFRLLLLIAPLAVFPLGLFEKGESQVSAKASLTRVEFYEVQDLLTPPRPGELAGESLMVALEELLEIENWDETASLELQGGILIARQTAEGHEKIRAYLDGLQATNSLFVQIEAKSLSMSEDFLAELGIDVWDLSAVAPNGGFNPNSIGVGRDLNGAGSPVFNRGFITGPFEGVIDGTAAGFLAGHRLNGPELVSIHSLQVLSAEQQASARCLADKVSDTQLRFTTADGQSLRSEIVAEGSWLVDYELSSGSPVVPDLYEIAAKQTLPLRYRATVSDNRDRILIDLLGASVQVPDGGAMLAIYQSPLAYSFVLIEARVISLREER